MIKPNYKTLHHQRVKLTVKIDDENVVPLFPTELFYNKNKVMYIDLNASDAFLMPLSEKLLKRRYVLWRKRTDSGEKIGTQDFEAECVLLPSQKYLNIPWVDMSHIPG